MPLKKVVNLSLKSANHFPARPLVKNFSSTPSCLIKPINAAKGSNNNPNPNPKSLLRPPSVLGISDLRPFRRESLTPLIPAAIS